MAEKIGDFVFHGYDVSATSNGGYLVRKAVAQHEFRGPESMASFTNTQDLFAWLKVAHEQFEEGVK